MRLRVDMLTYDPLARLSSKCRPADDLWRCRLNLRAEHFDELVTFVALLNPATAILYCRYIVIITITLSCGRENIEVLFSYEPHKEVENTFKIGNINSWFNLLNLNMKTAFFFFFFSYFKHSQNIVTFFYVSVMICTYY